MSSKIYRINQIAAKATGLSRRQIDEIIKKKGLKINGEIAEIGQKVSLDEQIEIYQSSRWRSLYLDPTSQTIIFYKPIFSLVSRSGEGKKKTIYDLLPKQYENLKPAGRLDYMSEGLLVLSEDGNLINDLTHPSKGTQKKYLVALKSKLPKEALKAFKSGLTITEDGAEGSKTKTNPTTYKLSPVKVKPLDANDDLEFIHKFQFLNLESKWQWYLFTLQEGRNNQIRKMCGVFGQRVQRLIRISHGKFELTEDLLEKKFLGVSSD